MLLPTPPHILWKAPKDGPNVVWIPGRGGTSWSLLPLVTRMRRGTHLVLDHHSSKGYKLLEESNLGLIQAMALNIVETCRKYFDTYHLAGISMGGLVAQEIAISHPEDLQSLHLLCTVTGGGGNRTNFVTEYCLQEWSTKPLPHEDPILKALQPCVGEDCLEKTYFKNFYSHTLLTPIPPTGSVLGYQWQALYQYSSRDGLKNIQLPTFCYHGSQDRVIDPGEMEFIHQQISDSRFFEYPSGHLFFLEFWKEFLSDLNGNIDSIPLKSS